MIIVYLTNLKNGVPMPRSAAFITSVTKTSVSSDGTDMDTCLTKFSTVKYGSCF